MPQGSTLGPLLFLLYINDIAYVSKFKIALFADDTCLYLSHKNPVTLERLCNEELVYITDWFKANKLTVNLKKASKFMITPSNPNNTIMNFNLKMGDTILEEVSEIVYLGVIFDRHFTWKPYIKGGTKQNFISAYPDLLNSPKSHFTLKLPH